MAKLLTNSFILRDGKILLGLKKRGFGANLYNGFGGKIHEGESPLEAAQREFREEAGVEMANPEQVGQIVYTYEDIPKPLHVYVFRATDYQNGEIAESEEMRPEWFEWSKIPLHQMWADDPFWYEHLKLGTKFKARFDFAADKQTILHHEVYLVTDEHDPKPNFFDSP